MATIGKKTLPTLPSKFYDYKGAEDNYNDITLLNMDKKPTKKIMVKQDVMNRKDFLIKEKAAKKNDIKGDIKQIQKETKKKENTKDKNIMDLMKIKMKTLTEVKGEDRKRVI